MKRKIMLLAAAAMMLAGSFTAQAEGFLIKGGLTFTSASKAKEALAALNVNGATQWEAGFGYQTDTWAGFSIQPEFIYRSKGLNVESSILDAKFRMHNLEIPVNIQWGPDLLIMRPFIFAAPYIGYNISGTVKMGEETIRFTDSALIEDYSKFQYGLGLGLGLDISKFQITAKYNWDFGSAISWQEYKSSIQAIDTNTGAFEIAVAIIF